ncbi:MAG: hypothetical protein QF595_07170 [Dehalococcoidia bacterium]|nr:hypothetical protein [Dehalococcoidia bacterium]
MTGLYGVTAGSPDPKSAAALSRTENDRMINNSYLWITDSHLAFAQPLQDTQIVADFP